MTDAAREFAAALGEVLTQFGRRVVDNPTQLRGALSDTLGASASEHAAQVDAVVAASREGIAGQIRDADPAVPVSPERVRAWFDQLVAAGVGLRDAALATTSWAEALRSDDAARVASEVSVELLGADRADSARRSDVVSAPEPASIPPRPPLPPVPPLPPASEPPAASALVAPGALEEPTDLEDMSRLRPLDDDRTRLPSDERSRLADAAAAAAVVASQVPVPPSPVPAPPTAPSPASGGPAPEDSARDAVDTSTSTAAVGSARGPRSPWLRAALFVPAAVAVVVMVVALVNGQSAIAANEAPRSVPEPVSAAALAAPLAAAVEKPVGSALLTKPEVMAMMLTEAQLKKIIVKPSDEFTWGPQERPASDSRVVAGKKLTPSNCAAALKLAPAGGVLLESYGSNNGGTGKYVFVDNMAVWYPTAAAAADAFNTLKIAAGCAHKATYVQASPKDTWHAHAAQSTGKVGGVTVLHTQTVIERSSGSMMDRYCYLRVNVVSCVMFGGYESGHVVAAWRSSSRAGKLNAMATAAVTASSFEIMEAMK